jgi:hypothetical protein
MKKGGKKGAKRATMNNPIADLGKEKVENFVTKKFASMSDVDHCLLNVLVSLANEK